MKKLVTIIVSLISLVAGADTVKCKSLEGAKNEITIDIKEVVEGQIEGTFVRKYMPHPSTGATDPVTEKGTFNKEFDKHGLVSVFTTKRTTRHDGRAGDSYVFIPYNIIGSGRGLVLSQSDTSLKTHELNCSVLPD